MLSAVALDSLDDANAAAARLTKELGSDAYELRPLLTALLLESLALICISSTVKKTSPQLRPPLAKLTSNVNPR